VTAANGDPVSGGSGAASSGLRSVTETTRPASTYRVQVRPGFDLVATAELAGYLAELGVTHLYTAPLLAATPGSSHGYDVVDHRRVNPELGGEAGLTTLRDALRVAGLGLVVDLVPNHAGVGVAAANPAWWDVLRHGRESAFAGWFDIDWSRGRIVLPVLAEHPGALDDLRVVGDELRYFEHRFPIAPGTAGTDPRAVHERQHYELVSWRRGNTDLNYRRFFAINELAALRVEDPAVFDATHAEPLRWRPDGIRVDHPDGLRGPAGYLHRLRAAAPDAWLVVEKILEPGEELPDWPVAGTTGYDALAAVCGLFVDPAGEAAFTALDTRLCGGPTTWPALVHDAKYAAATELLAAELGRLARLADDDTPGTRAALAETAAAFPTYRSYLPDHGKDDLTAALDLARTRRPDLRATIDRLAPALGDATSELALRFQQFTGAVMAKGVEDTAYYRWTRFVALNEVGGDPARFGVAPVAFHAAAARRLARWPAGQTTLSTHDTKRGEDVRARLAVLSELPDEWAAAVDRWMTAAPVPDPATAHLLWQTVAGTWPIERERLQAYLLKATREAATHTSWTDPVEDFEAAVRAAVDRAYDDPALRADVDAFTATLTGPGRSNALGQKLVQLLMPGVADVYQGTELWDNSLVDPDNRRPVDFDARRSLLANLDAGWQPPADAPAAKLLVTSRALRVRRDRPLRAYHPLGDDEHVVAFDRGGVVVVVTRLPVRLHRSGGWGGQVLPLPPGRWTDVLTDRRVYGNEPPLRDLLDRYPVALLVRE
jgi:(1->4)-alpha-D-glucan 1-alpha-D-glucosylmutase